MLIFWKKESNLILFTSAYCSTGYLFYVKIYLQEISAITKIIANSAFIRKYVPGNF